MCVHVGQLVSGVPHAIRHDALLYGHTHEHSGTPSDSLAHSLNNSVDLSSAVWSQPGSPSCDRQPLSKAVYGLRLGTRVYPPHRCLRRDHPCSRVLLQRCTGSSQLFLMWTRISQTDNLKLILPDDRFAELSSACSCEGVHPASTHVVCLRPEDACGHTRDGLAGAAAFRSVF